MSGSRQHAGAAEPTRFWQKIGLVADISSLCRRLDQDRDGMLGILELIQRIVPFDAATLYLYDSAAKSLVAGAQLGETVSPPGFVIVRNPAPGSGWRVRNKKSLLYHVTEDDEEFESDSSFMSVIMVPLLVDTAVVGILCLGSYHAGILEQKHVMLAEIVANQLAVAIERSNYVATIKASHQALQTAHRELQSAQT
ncbi:GAF domain-containing protein, partial [candidate division GN15 bacterium]|nr:GAF domain-containing protein [candidate division GN15 bacterium]